MSKQTILETTFAILSFAIHALDARQNIWARILAFPILCTYAYIYAARHLYGKVAYSVLGICINGYAYVRWKSSATRPHASVTRTSKRALFRACLLIALGTLLWQSCLTIQCAHRPTLMASLDACCFFIGLVEKWMMAHKKVERWLLAFLRYAFMAIACYQAGSVVLALHQIFLLLLSLYGQRKWYKAYKNAQVG